MLSTPYVMAMLSIGVRRRRVVSAQNIQDVPAASRRPRRAL
jgi:hypothetical protein